VAVAALILMTVPAAPVATAQEECEQSFYQTTRDKFRQQGWVQVQRVTDASVSRQVVLDLYEGPLEGQEGRSIANGIDAYVTCTPKGTNDARDHKVCLKRLQPDFSESLTQRSVDQLIATEDTQADLKVALFDGDEDRVATVDPDVPRLENNQAATDCSRPVDIPGNTEVAWAAVFADSGPPQGVQHRISEGAGGVGLFTSHFELNICASPAGPCS
jgi:hypothetical protein